MKSRKKENTINENIELQPHTLTDLPITGEKADETKGGGGHVKLLGGSAGGYAIEGVDVIVGGGGGAPGGHVK